MTDIYAIVPAVAGKIELVYEGEQEGSALVALNLIGKAINKVFTDHFPKPSRDKPSPDLPPPPNPYEAVQDFFAGGRILELSDEMCFKQYKTLLKSLPGLESIVRSNFDTNDKRDLLLRMELVLEGLHHNNVIARQVTDSVISYGDMFSDLLKGMSGRS
jgi:magnesium chelatase subunit I